MIYAFAARPWIFFLEHFLTHALVRGGNGAASTNHRAATRSSGFELRPQGMREHSGSVQNFFSAQIFREFARETRFVREPAGRAVFSSSGGLGSRKTASERGSGESAFGMGRLSRTGLAAVMPLTRFLARHTPVVVPAVRRSVRETTAGADELAANVTQKHRRIEERRLAASRDPGPAFGISGPSESMVTVERRPAQNRKTRISSVESEPLNSPARQEFPINVARVTDEILKQLDRRVIAARERMGKI